MEDRGVLKFLKQDLNFKHLMNRSLNGIKVMIYMTLILALQITVYKKENKLTRYKIVKLKIVNELHDSLIREIVINGGRRFLSNIPLLKRFMMFRTFMIYNPRPYSAFLTHSIKPQDCVVWGNTDCP